MNAEKVVDVRFTQPWERHPRIFKEWQGLPVGGTLKLVNDHDPKPLFYEFNAERAGEFEWNYVERGPEKWVVDIKRIASAKPAGTVNLDQTVREVVELYPATREVFFRHGLDLCCGGAHPVRMAAQAHGVDPDALLEELNGAAGAASAPGPRASCGHHPVLHLKDAAPRTVEEEAKSSPGVFTLDVRGLEPPEPMVRILSQLPQLGPQDVLEVTHFREPFPLYPHLEEAGFAHSIEKRGESLYLLTIRRRG